MIGKQVLVLAASLMLSTTSASFLKSTKHESEVSKRNSFEATFTFGDKRRNHHSPKVPSLISSNVSKISESQSNTHTPSACGAGEVLKGTSSGQETSASRFVPWVSWNSEWYPICGHFLWDNQNAAIAFCKKLGFQSGVVHAMHGTYSKDAMPVGKCADNSADLTACTHGGNAWGNLDYRGGWCKAGHGVSVEFECSGGSSQNKFLSRGICTVHV